VGHGERRVPGGGRHQRAGRPGEQLGRVGAHRRDRAGRERPRILGAVGGAPRPGRGHAPERLPALRRVGAAAAIARHTGTPLQRRAVLRRHRRVQGTWHGAHRHPAPLHPPVLARPRPVDRGRVARDVRAVRGRRGGGVGRGAGAPRPTARPPLDHGQRAEHLRLRHGPVGAAPPDPHEGTRRVPAHARRAARRARPRHPGPSTPRTRTEDGPSPRSRSTRTARPSIPWTAVSSTWPWPGRQARPVGTWPRHSRNSVRGSTPSSRAWAGGRQGRPTG